MAWDLWYRCHIPKNIALFSAVDDRPLSEDRLLSDDEKAFVAKLAVIKMNAEAGNKKAIADWRRVLAGVAAQRKKASKGDARAKRFVAVVEDSGLLLGMTSVTMGDDLTPRERSVVAIMANLQLKARQGDPRAKRIVGAISALKLGV